MANKHAPMGALEAIETVGPQEALASATPEEGIAPVADAVAPSSVAAAAADAPASTVAGDRGGHRVTLSSPLGPDGRSRSVEVVLAPREALVGVRVERERQVYVTDHGRELAVDAAGEVTVREVDG